MADSPERLDLSVSVSEEELLAAAKPYFKERGFAKKASAGQSVQTNMSFFS